MLQITQLSFYHQRNLRPLIENLTLTVHPGDKVAVIGEEGTGKSSLFNYLVDPSKVSGYLHIQGQVMNTFGQIAYLQQLLSPEILNLPLASFIFEDSLSLDFNRLYQLADQLQFDSRRFESQQTLGQLSGGERLKVRLIKMLVQTPYLLLLDEPTSDLDGDSLTWLARLIQDLDLAILFISHDEWFLTQTAIKILHLEQVKKHSQARCRVAALTYSDYIADREARFTKQSQVAKKEREDFQEKMSKLQQHKSAVAHALRNTRYDVEGRLLAKKMKNLKTRQGRFTREADDFTPIPI